MRSCLQVVLVSIAMFFGVGLIAVTAGSRTRVGSIDLSMDTPLIPMSTVSTESVHPERDLIEQMQQALMIGDEHLASALGFTTSQLRLATTGLPIPVHAAGNRADNTPNEQHSFTVNASNLRSGPGTTYDIVGTLQAGEAVMPVAINSGGDWYQLEDGAWIAAFLVAGAPADLPIAETH